MRAPLHVWRKRILFRESMRSCPVSCFLCSTSFWRDCLRSSSEQYGYCVLAPRAKPKAQERVTRGQSLICCLATRWIISCCVFSSHAKHWRADLDAASNLLCRSQSFMLQPIFPGKGAHCRMPAPGSHLVCAQASWKERRQLLRIYVRPQIQSCTAHIVAEFL
jgi:hypothetical protein